MHVIRLLAVLSFLGFNAAFAACEYNVQSKASFDYIGDLVVEARVMNANNCSSNVRVRFVAYDCQAGGECFVVAEHTHPPQLFSDFDLSYQINEYNKCMDQRKGTDQESWCGSPPDLSPPSIEIPPSKHKDFRHVLKTSEVSWFGDTRQFNVFVYEVN